MFAYDLLPAFAVATLSFAFLPGPALLYSAAQTLAGGRRGGFRAVLGIHIGGYAHVLAAAFGLSAVFAAAPTAYMALKLAGAAYLCWIGARILWSLREPVDAPDPDAAIRPHAVKSLRRALRDSVVVEVLNPKAALFFLAFLPQFVDPAAGAPIWVQFLVLGTLVNLTFSFADVCTVLAADKVVGAAKSSPRSLAVARFAGGAVMLGLGLRLALARE